METTKSRLKLKTKNPIARKHGSSVGKPQQTGGMPDNKYGAEEVIEILDNSDSSDTSKPAVFTTDTEKTSTAAGGDAITDKPLETLRQILLSLTRKREQTPWQELPDLPPYQPFHQETEEADIQNETCLPEDILPPLPKPCYCLMHRTQKSRTAPVAVESIESTSDTAARVPGSRTEILDTVATSSTVADRHKQGHGEWYFEGSRATGTTPVQKMAPKLPAAGSNLVRHQPPVPLPAAKTSQAETKSGDLHQTAKPTLVPDTTNMMANDDGTDFEPVSNVSQTTTVSKREDSVTNALQTNLSATNKAGKRKENAIPHHSEISKASGTRLKQSASTSRQSSQSPLQSSGEDGKRKSLFGTSFKRSRSLTAGTSQPEPKQPKIETFTKLSAQPKSGFSHTHSGGTSDKSVQQTSGGSSCDEDKGSGAEPGASSDGALSSCPLCQVNFQAGMSQVDIDGHIAACFAASSDDIVW